MEDTDLTKCRLCMQSDDCEMFDLFMDDVMQNNIDNLEEQAERKPVKLAEKVEYCCGVRIRQSSEMPSKICIKCFDLTRIWFNFRQMVVNSQVYLESMCTDRKKPIGADADESAYLDYLLQDLQTVRANMHVPQFYNANEDDDDDDDEFVQYDVTLDETGGVDSDPNFENIIENIKTERNYDGSELDGGDDDDDEDYEIKPKATGKRGKQLLPERRKTGVGTGVTKKKTKSALKRELRPPSPGSYMCSVCGNVYTKKASFTYHMSLHSNVKPHECEICNKAFRQVSELKNHMRRHTGERPYKCTYCERRFVDRSEKHRHERVHTNTRPYVCTVCGKSFAYSTILKNHSKLHSGEKDYNCLVCHKSFSLQHQLKAHLQTLTHKQKEAQCVAAGYEVVYE